MVYKAYEYCQIWESRYEAESVSRDVKVSITTDSGNPVVTLNIKRGDGTECDIIIDLDNAGVHNEWRFPGETQ
jgi:hypothetical protein